MIYFKFYTPDWGWLYGEADGRTFGFIIFIKDYLRDDKCLLEHEKAHVRQFWRIFIGEFKSKCEREREAYDKEWECIGQSKWAREYFDRILKKYCGEN